MTTAPTDPESTTRLTACNLCEAICGLVLTIEQRPDGPAVTGVRGNAGDPLSRGHVCPKGVAIADVQADPDRLRTPVRRVGRGADATWEEISWDEAVRLAADGLADTQQQHGRDAVGVYLGNPNVHSLGAMTHGVRLAKTLRTHNTYSATSVDQLPAQLLAWQLYGHQLMIPVPDLDRTELFLVVGANPMASNGSLMTVPDFPARVRELKARGGRMIVLDPRRTETAAVADEHHFVRPGSDAAVLLAMVHTLLAEDLTDVPSYVRGVEAVRLAVADLTPERAAAVSGLAAEEIRRLARDFAAAGRAAAYGRMGLSTQGFGSLGQWAVHLLNVLTGNLDREGGVMFTEPAIDVVGRGLVGRGHLGAWRSRVRGLPEFSGELPVSALREEITTPGEGQVRALLTVAGNPVLSTPDGAGLSRALEGLDFMVSVDIYLNETTRHADVVLPPTTALERDHYDLVFHALAVRNTARFSPAVLPKPAGSRHDWEIFRDLALRITGRRPARGTARLRRVADAAVLRTSPTRLVELLLLAGRRTTLRALRAHPEGVDLGALRPVLPGRLQTRDKLVHLAPDLVLADLDRLRRSLDAPQAAEGELLLIGRRHQRTNNSWMHNTPRLTRGKARHQLLVHPDDLAAHGLADGDRVRITSRVGSVITEVQATDDVMPGVVSLPHGYGHGGPGNAGTRLAHANGVAGVSVNDLTDPERLDVSGNAALNGVPVTLAPADAHDDGTGHDAAAAVTEPTPAHSSRA
ncbi:molybdopterin-dependent oxidoreductase [Nocardioides aurantiacus]|uniref:Anaerobic selenocysteine-containing dehydrogenase n=1 Tax=Nocardioides aurantiacus TaxID=86796 RepID=A0A3N2CX46_9ACTN|nr:molybdopterin-dependent oxidoreductase [Nocardioides aurantiacus]ROR92091.1 anaerobic selenocysteine-containing dehydrogenase [Nocardioides aurantiacus]